MVGVGRALQRSSSATPLIKKIGPAQVAHGYRSLRSSTTRGVKSFESAVLGLEPPHYRQKSNTSRYTENFSHSVKYFIANI